jgi:hypothetical protein
VWAGRGGGNRYGTNIAEIQRAVVEVLMASTLTGAQCCCRSRELSRTPLVTAEAAALDMLDLMLDLIRPAGPEAYTQFLLETAARLRRAYFQHGGLIQQLISRVWPCALFRILDVEGRVLTYPQRRELLKLLDADSTSSVVLAERHCYSKGQGRRNRRGGRGRGGGRQQAMPQLVADSDGDEDDNDEDDNDVVDAAESARAAPESSLAAVADASERFMVLLILVDTVGILESFGDNR